MGGSEARRRENSPCPYPNLVRRIHVVLAVACAAVLAPTSTRSDEDASKAPPEIRVGIIGLDTSHAPAFTKAFLDPQDSKDLAACRVVAAYPKGSPDIESSVSRVPKYTAELRELGVDIVDSIAALVERVDAVLLETNDGRPHLDQIVPVLEAGKPVFVDKPVAGSLADAIAIYELASAKKVPVFSSSSLRYMKSAQEIRGGAIGDVLGADVYSPAWLEKTHPDLFWYGIHGVETLFTVMGTGCVSVTRTTTPGADVVVGHWANGRIGTFRGLRSGKTGYGGIAFGAKGNRGIGPYGGYRPLVIEIAQFFRTGTKPISDRETIEIYAFMEAADESKRRGGESVELKSVIERARREATERLSRISRIAQ